MKLLSLQGKKGGKKTRGSLSTELLITSWRKGGHSLRVDDCTSYKDCVFHLLWIYPVKSWLLDAGGMECYLHLEKVKAPSHRLWLLLRKAFVSTCLGLLGSIHIVGLLVQAVPVKACPSITPSLRIHSQHFWILSGGC